MSNIAKIERQARRGLTLKERFHRLCVATDDDNCWEWIGSKGPKGYGRMREGARESRIKGAHRVSWEIHNGEIPDGLCVLHKCDNPSCVNPNHLFLGTYADNNKDRDQKGRHRALRGQSNGFAKLTESQVRRIKKDNRTSIAVAADYGVSHSLIRRIRSGEVWNHV